MDSFSPKKRLFLSIVLSIVILIIVVIFYFQSQSKINKLSFSDFDLYDYAGTELSLSSLNNFESGFVYIYNVTGFKRAYDNKIYLVSVIKILTPDNIPVRTKKTLLQMYSDFPGEKIPMVKVVLDFNSLNPGQYILEVTLFDQISNQMISIKKPILISGKYQYQ